jgi:DHA1 family tetracycline resistance protein-like MFS transporter
MEPFHRITLVYALFSFCAVFADPIFSVYLTAKGYDPAWMTIILSSFSLTMIFVAPLLGGISDVWGRRPLILGGIILEILVLFSYALFTHPMLIFITRMFEAIAYASVIFVAIAKMEDIVSEQKKKNVGEQVGKSLSIGKLGHVFGPLIGGLVAVSFGITAPFYGAGMILILLGGWYYFEKHHTHPKLPYEKITFNPLPRMREYLKIKPLKGLVIVEGAHQFSMPVLFVFIPLFLTQNLGLSLAQVGIAIFIRELPMLFQFWGGKLSDKWGSRKTLLLGSTLSGVSLLAFSIVTTFDWVLVVSLMFGIGTSLLGISGLSLLSGIAEKNKQEGTFLGTQVSVIKIGAFIAFLLAGIIVQISSIPTLFLFTGAVILLGVILGENFLGVRSFPLPNPKRLIDGIFHHR